MFWNNFYNICQAKGTTPNAVCKKLELSNAIATHWKNGTMPKADVLVKIAELLECSTDYLLGLTDNPDASVKNRMVIGHNSSRIATVNSDAQSNDNAIVEIETIISRLTGASRYRAIADVLEVLEKYA
ncbi:MAG: helix-turn-helix domain-containing protein [Alistipes senegalensis]|nr:helix-turn-helix domain-containing protein [Alistipes senegalensis]